MFGWIRREIGIVRQRLALLHGRACPQCGHRTVRRRDRAGARSCNHCGFKWRHSWSLGPTDGPQHPINW